MENSASDQTTLTLEPDHALSAHSQFVVALLNHYSFDLHGYPAEQLVSHWIVQYQSSWIELAVIEALYQGRYKAVSVEQILACWWRRGKPLCHFNREFERIICSHFSAQFPRVMLIQSDSAPRSQPAPVAVVKVELPVAKVEPAPENPFMPKIQTSDTEAAPPATEGIPTFQPELIPPFVAELEPETVAEAPVPQEAVLEDFQPVEVEAEVVTAPQEEEPEFISLLAAEPSVTPLPTEVPELLFKLNPERQNADHWVRSEAWKHPIHQFVPTTELSGSITKLKTVSQASSADS